MEMLRMLNFIPHNDFVDFVFLIRFAHFGYTKYLLHTNNLLIVHNFVFFFLFRNTYDVGSSRKMTDGLLINSSAILIRFFCPPDKDPHLVL